MNDLIAFKFILQPKFSYNTKKVGIILAKNMKQACDKLNEVFPEPLILSLEQWKKTPYNIILVRNPSVYKDIDALRHEREYEYYDYT